MLRFLYKWFDQRQWARKKLGGKWERLEEGWVQVMEWSSPRSRPDLYGTGSIPEREEWHG